MNVYTSPSAFKEKLGNSFGAFLDLLRFIRVNYVMDELWDGEAELKFRRSGKTLVTLCIKENCFNALIIFGKAERAVFDEIRGKFSDFVCNYYDNSRIYHDGKWMFIDIEDGTYLNDIIEMIKIKKKPNRKINIAKAEFGQCGQRCDQCLLYVKNNESARGNVDFHEKDWICYHSEDEVRVDYTNMICAGCYKKGKDECPEKVCLQEKDIQSCSQCSEHCACKKNSHDFDPARCNLGLSADDITQAVMPYYSNFWLDKQITQSTNSGSPAKPEA